MNGLLSTVQQDLEILDVFPGKKLTYIFLVMHVCGNYVRVFLRSGLHHLPS